MAEVTAEVGRPTAPWWRADARAAATGAGGHRRASPGSAWPALPSYLERRQQNAEVAALLGRSRAQIDAGDHASAWKTLEQANAVAPTSRDVFSAQEQLAMKRLRGAGLRYGSGGRARDEDLVKMTLPVSPRRVGCERRVAGEPAGPHGMGGLLAEGLAGSGGPDPEKHYRTALEADPANVYAHAMWGFELLRDPRSPTALAEAKQHFTAALATGREREYPGPWRSRAVADVHQRLDRGPRAAKRGDPGGERDADRQRDEAERRGAGPAQEQGVGHLLLGFVAADERAQLLAALPRQSTSPPFAGCSRKTTSRPTGETTSSSSTCSFSPMWREYGADRAGALASYRRLLSEFGAKKYDGTTAIKMIEQTKAAIRRLGN